MVQLEDITGDIRVMARHCRVKLKNTVSDYLIIKNTYRHIDIKNISGKNVDIFITHGDLSLTFDKIEERINIKNRHSDIIMNYSKSVNPSFNINTSYGKIINRTATEFNILKEKHKLSLFTMEDTPEIIINNTYGNILLKNYD